MSQIVALFVVLYAVMVCQGMRPFGAFRPGMMGAGSGFYPSGGGYGNQFGGRHGNQFGGGYGNQFGGGYGNQFGGGYGNQFGDGYGNLFGGGYGNQFGKCL